MAGFLGSLVLLLVTGPLVKHLKNGGMLDAVVLTVVLLAAVQAVGHRRRVLVWCGVLAAPAVVGRWLYQIWPGQFLQELYLVGGLLFISFIIIQLLRYILRAPRVDSEVLCAGISTYLMLGVLWSLAYLFVDCRIQGAFAMSGAPETNHAMQGFDALYYSIITLTTVGYGDITPVSDVARMLASLEALTGTLFVAVLISRLVAVYTKSSPEDSK